MIKMRTRFLLHFVQEHVSFRWPEFQSLASKNKCDFKLISPIQHTRTRPYIVIELNEGTPLCRLIECAKGSYLLKDLYELWSESRESLEDLNHRVRTSPMYLSRTYASPDQTFRVNCESYGSKLTQIKKVEWIQKMLFLEDFQCRPDLKNPKQVYCIFEMNDKEEHKSLPVKTYYLGRHLACSDRAAIHHFSLKKRIFIANTSMDPMLSLLTANVAKVQADDLVYDPFVGSGGLLVAAAYKGAYVFGTDIDWLLLHGKSRPSRKSDTVRKKGESVRANFEQYNLTSRYLDVSVSDITRSPLRRDLLVDAIITDPPYGIRECSEKIGLRRKPLPDKDYKVRYPSKTSYGMRDLFGDLLTLSVKHLKIGGRLVYYLPVVRGSHDYCEFIPTHPCLELIAYCDQELTGRAARLLVIMEKTREAEAGDISHIPQIVSDMNFRDSYFSGITI